MRKLAFYFTFILSFNSFIHLSATNWQKSFGPFQGAINKVYVDRINPAILYAVTSNAVYKTMNEGQSWQQILESDAPIYVFAIAPGNQNIIYTNSQKSTDGGVTWSTIQPVPYSKIEFNLNSEDDINNKLAIHPLDANILYAALSSFGMYRSTDGAETWNIIPDAPRGLVVFNSSSPAQLFCAGSDSFNITTNNGNTWLSMGVLPEAANYVPKKLVHDTGILYILQANGVDQLQGERIILSRNNGIDWTEVALNIPFHEYLTEINSVSAKDGYLFVATNIGLYRSIDEGLTWTHFSGDFDDLNHVDFTNRIIVGSKHYGVSVTRDLTNDWQNIGLHPLSAANTTLLSDVTGALFVQWQGGLWQQKLTTDTWRSIIPPHKTVTMRSAITLSKQDSSSVLAIYDHNFIKYSIRDDEWLVLGSFPADPKEKIATSPNDDVLFCRSTNGLLYRSINGGLSWQTLDTPIGESILDFHYSDKNNFYLLTDLNYYSSIDNGTSFQALRTGLPVENLQSTTIWFDTKETDHLFLQMLDKIYHKKQATALWEIYHPQTSLVFPKIGQCLICSPDSSESIFAVIPEYYDGASYLARFGQMNNTWLPIKTNFDSASFMNFNFAAFAPYELYHIDSNGNIWHGDVLATADTIDFSSARIQIVHSSADPSLDSLDIYLNKTPIIDNIKRNEATPFFDVPAGALARFGIAKSTSTSALDSIVSIATTFAAGQAYNVLISGVQDTTRFTRNPDGASRWLHIDIIDGARHANTTSNKVEFRFYNQVSDAPAIDLVVRDLAEIADSTSFGNYSDYITLTPDDYVFELKPSSEDSIRLVSFHVDLRTFAEKTFTLTLTGFLDPIENQNGQGLTLVGTLPNGQQVIFDNEQSEPGTPIKTTLISPSNAVLNVSLRPILKWRPTVRALSYQLQLDTHPAFTIPIIDTRGIFDTTAIVSSLAENQQFYWRVRGLNDSGDGEWSSVWQFTTTSSKAAPAAPVLLEPTDGSKATETTIGFVWLPVENTSNYTLEYSFNAQFSPALQLRNITDTTFTVDSLQNSTTYYWHVRAKNDSGESDWSERFVFTTKSAPDPLLQPQLVFPQDSAQNMFTNITLQWNAVSGASDYALEISNDEKFSPAIFYNSISKTSKRMHELKNSTTYYWRVRAADSTQQSEWSEVSSFTTVPNYPLAYSIEETLAIPAFLQSDQLESSDYRIIGFPGDAGFSLDSLFAGNQNESWKAFWDNGASSNYFIPFDGSEEFVLKTGRAFWVLHKGPIQIYSNFRTARLDTTGFVTIPLHAGWNMITNPFMSTVSWQMITKFNNVNQPIWKYDGSFLLADSMRPFEGYYYFNIESHDAIRIPYDALFDDENPESESKEFDEIHIKYASGSKIYDAITIGIFNKASNEFDQFDAIKPRNIARKPNLYIDNTKWNTIPDNYAIDVRPIRHAIQTWEIKLDGIQEQKGILKLSHNSVIHERSVYVHDHVNNTLSPVYKERQIPVNTSTGTGHWTLLLATKEELENYQINSMAGDIQMQTPFPSPFTTTTRVPILCRERQHVEMRVFNIMGAHVVKLYSGEFEKGFHEISWNGKDSNNNSVSSGLYFIVLTTAEERRVAKVIYLN